MQVTTEQINRISEPLATEGTAKTPRKFSLTEIALRVRTALTSALTGKLEVTEEQLTEYVSSVTDGLRKLDRIKKANV